MIDRPDLKARLEYAFQRSPIVALLGPRQCGKTTLARAWASGKSPVHTFDLEDPVDRARLQNPFLALSDLRGYIILDEIQRDPGLFPILRVLADRPGDPARFLLLGSASPGIARVASESLAGRTAFVDMAGFTLRETGAAGTMDLWFRGGFPRSYLAPGDGESAAWREDFIRTFLERDIPTLGINVPSLTLRRFWTMVAHYHGNIWNAAEFARSMGTGETSARRYLDIVTGADMVRQLPPWHENGPKRQVKSPKVYIRDSGILHSLLGLRDRMAWPGHPKYGAGWEGFALEQILDRTGDRDAYFWTTYAGAELDLLILRNGRRVGFEMKCADAPVLTKSMAIALSDLGLESLYVLYPGSRRYPIAEKAEVLPLKDLETIREIAK